MSDHPAITDADRDCARLIIEYVASVTDPRESGRTTPGRMLMLLGFACPTMMSNDALMNAI